MNERVRLKDGLRSYPSEGPLYGEPIYPGHGYPPRPGEDRPGLSPFGRLTKGGNLGNSAILIYDKDANGTQAANDIIAINGDDADACQMVVTLHPPRVVSRDFEYVLERLDKQNISGEQTNSEITTEDFPGTSKPIIWPPFEVEIEFGTGGVSSTLVADYLNGVTLSLVASYLRVHVLVSQTKDTGDIFGTSAAYRLAAHVGPGFAVNHISRTVYAGVIDDDRESDIIDIPKFAKRASLFGCRIKNHRPTITEGWIRFFQSPDGSSGVGDCFVTGSQRSFDVPNGAQYFSVLNESGHHMKMSVVFGLGL